MRLSDTLVFMIEYTSSIYKTSNELKSSSKSIYQKI